MQTTITVDGSEYEVARVFTDGGMNGLIRRVIIRYQGVYVFCDPNDSGSWDLTTPEAVLTEEQRAAMTALVERSGTLDTTVTTVTKDA